MKWPFVPAARLSALLALFLAADRVTASTISAVEAQGIGRAVELDHDPIITAVLNPHNFILVDDGTGSMAIFSTNGFGAFVPTVGDNIRAQGTYTLFDQIPELRNVVNTTLISVGNPVPPPIAATISQLNVPVLPLHLAGHLIDLEGVRISGAPATFGEEVRFSATITDSGNHSMALFYSPVQLLTSGMNLSGLAVPTGPVNMTGIVSEALSGNDMIAEFSPLTITSVPEPPALTLAGIGAVFILAFISRHGCARKSYRDIATEPASSGDSQRLGQHASITRPLPQLLKGRGNETRNLRGFSAIGQQASQVRARHMLFSLLTALAAWHRRSRSPSGQ